MSRASKHRAEYFAAMGKWTIWSGYADRPRRYIRFTSQDKAREWARKQTERPEVIWVSVYPPVPKVYDGPRPVHKWTRSKGWTTS